MSEHTSNNKRIAKNTLLLYGRMLFTMAISLYTSRVVLKALGVEDFGIYNVVGGVVAMFSTLTASLSAAISRFITFELGKGDFDKLKKIFSVSITVQLILSLIILLLTETIGTWFLFNKLVIPAERLNIGFWVFELSILTFIINLINIPYSACIMAHEKMSAFAYISILEAVGKLIISILIVFSPIDKLLFYSSSLCILSIGIRFIYIIYCQRNFFECQKFTLTFERNILKDMLGFAGWNMIGTTSGILRDQGGNILLNLFCGPTVNAAKGISQQVNNAVMSFVSNFMIAVNPQITKSYSTKEYEYMRTLIYQSSRFCFYLMLLFTVPVILNCKYILNLWLGNIPNHTIEFVQLILVFTMLDSILLPLITAMLATGKIKKYQIIVGGLNTLNLPISYVFLRFGYPPETVIIISIIISQICLIARLILLQNMIKISIKYFILNVYIKILIVGLFSIILPIIIKPHINNTFPYFIIHITICFISVIGTIYLIGFDRKEKEKLSVIYKKIKNKIVHEK